MNYPCELCLWGNGSCPACGGTPKPAESGEDRLRRAIAAALTMRDAGRPGDGFDHLERTVSGF